MNIMEWVAKPVSNHRLKIKKKKKVGSTPKYYKNGYRPQGNILVGSKLKEIRPKIEEK